MVALKRLADAERDGNRIYCVINGVGASSDGRAKSVYAPVPAGQAAGDRRGLRQGRLRSRTPSSWWRPTAPAPSPAMRPSSPACETVFGRSGRADRQWCALGSVKSQIGHTKAAAGAAGLIKAIMALHHRVLPPTAKVDRPNPSLDLANSPFYLNTRARPWVRDSRPSAARRRSAPSGSAARTSTSRCPSTPAPEPAPRACGPATSSSSCCRGPTPEIVAQARHHLDSIDSAGSSGYLAWIARDSQQRYESGAPARLAVVAADESDLRTKLDQAITLLTRAPDAAFRTPDGIAYGVGAATGDVGFVFPGQGSQYPFMGADLAMQFGAAIGRLGRAPRTCVAGRSRCRASSSRFAASTADEDADQPGPAHRDGVGAAGASRRPACRCCGCCARSGVRATPCRRPQLR